MCERDDRERGREREGGRMRGRERGERVERREIEGEKQEDRERERSDKKKCNDGLSTYRCIYDKMNCSSISIQRKIKITLKN